MKNAGITVFQASIILPFICYTIDHEMVKSQAKTYNFSTRASAEIFSGEKVVKKTENSTIKTLSYHV